VSEHLVQVPRVRAPCPTTPYPSDLSDSPMPDVPAPKYQRATWLVELNGTWVTYLEYLYSVENGLSDGLILLTQGKGRLSGHTYTHRSLADAGRDFVCCLFGGGGGGDESKRHRAESQWIVAARPLCHLQYPVAYLSRLQRIQPAARRELCFKAARTAHPTRGLSL
jgi:hypothetical protein